VKIPSVPNVLITGAVHAVNVQEQGGQLEPPLARVAEALDEYARRMLHNYGSLYENE